MVNYFSFKGRMNRLPYFFISVVAWVISLCAQYLKGTSIPLSNAGNLVLIPLDVLIWAFVIFLIWFLAAVSTRRLHDIGFSAWYLLVFLIPIIDVFFSFLLMIKKGDGEENKYGPDSLIAKTKESSPAVQ